MEIPHLPASELTVMKIIWDAGRPVQLADIYAVVNDRYGKEWQYQTVSTYIRSLVRRGFLAMERAGRAFLYTPLISEDDYLNYSMEQLAGFWGKKSLKPMVCALIDDKKLTEEDIQELRELLNDSDK